MGTHIDESIRKKIEEYIEEAYVGLNDDERQAPFTVGDLKAETRDDIEFGYQLGYEDAMKELTRQAIDANSVKPIFDRAMASESNEPSQDELWAELDRECIRLSYTGEVFFLTEEAKKRYRITRITS